MLNTTLLRDNSGQLYLINNATGEVYQQATVSGLGNVFSDMNFDSYVNSGTSGSGGTTFWQKLTNTAQDIYNSGFIQELSKQVNFQDGKFTFSNGGNTLQTQQPYSGGYNPNQAGFDWKPIALIGGAVLATVVIAKLMKPKQAA